MKKIKFLALFLLLAFSLSACEWNANKQNINEENMAAEENNEKSNELQELDNSKTPTSTAEIYTSDWLTYRNEDYGFVIKYPEDWVLNEKFDNIISFSIGIPESAEAIRVLGDNVFDDYEQLKSKKIEEYKNVTRYTSEISIDNEKAILIKTSEFGIIRIFFLHNGKLYEINTGGRMINMGILDTFKFIE